MKPKKIGAAKACARNRGRTLFVPRLYCGDAGKSPTLRVTSADCEWRKALRDSARAEIGRGVRNSVAAAFWQLN